MTDSSGERPAPTRGGIPADTLAHRLMLARSHAGGLSIREAAELCGFGRGAWTNWESKGSVPADADYVTEVIAEKLGVDVDWLRRGGQLAEPEARSRRARWSTVRPVHAGTNRIATHQYGQMASRGGGVAVRATTSGDRPGNRSDSRMPRDARPKGRPSGAAPAPTLRRPVRL